MTTKTDQLYAALEQARSQVPYAIARTEEGFRVELDLHIPEITQRVQRLSIKRTFAIDVRLHEGKAKARLTDTLKEIERGTGHTLGFKLTSSMNKGAVFGRTFTFGGSEQDKARDLEMKPYSIKVAKAWVRELLEANGWKVGGMGAIFR